MDLLTFQGKIGTDHSLDAKVEAAKEKPSFKATINDHNEGVFVVIDQSKFVIIADKITYSSSYEEVR